MNKFTTLWVSGLKRIGRQRQSTNITHKQNRASLATRITCYCLFGFLLFVSVSPQYAHAHDHDEGEEDEFVDPDLEVHPPFGEDYFEDNPEEGDSPWGPQVDACNDEVGCIVDNNDNGGAGGDSPASPTPPAAPVGPDPCDPVAPTAPTPDADQALAALTATIGVNPEQRGLTGLETWLWADEPPGQLSWTQLGTPGLNAACAELPAPTTTFTATIDSWTFHIDGEHDNTTYTSDTPGTEDDPAATHVFDYVGIYQLELTAHLRGAVTTPVTVDRRDYEVVEVRSHLTE